MAGIDVEYEQPGLDAGTNTDGRGGPDPRPPSRDLDRIGRRVEQPVFGVRPLAVAREDGPTTSGERERGGQNVGRRVGAGAALRTG